MICYGVLNALGCASSGHVVSHVGRPVQLLLAGILNVSLMVWMLLWLPGSGVLYFLVPGIWGIADGIWQTQTSGRPFANNFQYLHV